MLNKEGQRELAYVVAIDEIQPIEGAEKVELAVVGGWKIMVRKNQFHVGDLAVYFEIDSKVPAKEPFLFLADKKFRIRTQKYFKGTVISQGLLMSAEDFGWEVDKNRTGDVVAIGRHKRGDFLTKELEITYVDPEDNLRKGKETNQYIRMACRYPELFANPIIDWLFNRKWGRKILFAFLGNSQDKKANWPEWVQKTDEERVQNMPWILEDKSEWIATEKIDGTSTTATLRKTFGGKEKFYICSRNVVFDNRRQDCYYDTNVYTEMAEKYHFEEVLRAILEEYGLEWVTLQGETYGADIQKRDYGLKTHEFVGFNLILSTRGRLNSVEAAELMKEYGIPWVPIVDEHFILPDTVDELLKLASGKSAVDGGMREGLVLRSQDGSKSFKAVSNEFLLKYHS